MLVHKVLQCQTGSSGVEQHLKHMFFTLIIALPRVLYNCKDFRVLNSYRPHGVWYLWVGRVGTAGRKWVEWNHRTSLSLRMRPKIRFTRRFWGWIGRVGCLLHAER